MISGNVDAQFEDSGIPKQAADMICGRFRIFSRENFYPVVICLGTRKGNGALKSQLEAAFEKVTADDTCLAPLDRHKVAAPRRDDYAAARC